MPVHPFNLAAVFRRPRRARRGLTGPLLLALALAGTGQYMSTQATPAAANIRALSAAAESPLATSQLAPSPWSGGALRDAEYVLTLAAQTTVPKIAVSKPAVKPAAKIAARPARTPRRATRSTTRTVAPAATGRWVRPCVGAMTSDYGQRWGRMHRGIDLCGRYGITIVAASDGVVISAARMSDYGIQIQIRHASGAVTSYSHMSALLVRGGRVSAGTPIGRTGATGNVTGPHLHFEVKIGGSQVDPTSYLRQRGVYV